MLWTFIALFLLWWIVIHHSNSRINEESRRMVVKPQPVSILAPFTLDELICIVQCYPRISIVGANRSMGGQTWNRDSVQVDMRHFNQISEIDVVGETVAVEAGCTWEQVLHTISPHVYSIECMQSYCDFSVGGSISVNCHGQDVHHNPMSKSIVSIDLLTADGRIQRLGPTYELFHYVVGGYGLMGIIVCAKLKLTRNTRLHKNVYRQSISSFLSSKDTAGRVLCCARLDVNAGLFDSCLVIDLTRVKPESQQDRQNQQNGENEKEQEPIFEQLGAVNPSFYLAERLFFDASVAVPFLKRLRSQGVEQWYEGRHNEVTRNQYLLLETVSMHPLIQDAADRIMQEYFVPSERLVPFLHRLNTVVQMYHIDLMYAAVRFINADPATILSYAPADRVGIVLVVNINTYPSALSLQAWTQEIVDSVIRYGGSFYLPYHNHVTRDQFRLCYPSYDRFVRKKMEIDPNEKFMLSVGLVDSLTQRNDAGGCCSHSSSSIADSIADLPSLK